MIPWWTLPVAVAASLLAEYKLGPWAMRQLGREERRAQAILQNMETRELWRILQRTRAELDRRHTR